MFSTVRKFYGHLKQFAWLIFKCVINNRDEEIVKYRFRVNICDAHK